MTPNRIFGLDILRATAIMCVMIYHCMLIVFDEHIEWVLYAPIPDGVELFFVLSGFLIGKIFINKYLENGIGADTMLSFWKNRWFRTLPAYFFTLGVIIVLFYFQHDKMPNFMKYVFFIKTLFAPKNGIFPESWSLAIEEWFYLSLPILVFMLDRLLRRFISKEKVIIIYISFIIVFSIIIRLYIYTKIPSQYSIIWGEYFRSTTLIRLDSIIYGVLAAYISIRYKEKFSSQKLVLFIFGGISLILLFLYHKLNYKSNDFSILYRVMFYPACSILVMCTLPMFNSIRKYDDKNIYYKLIFRISTISYSLYLVNLTIVGENLKKYISNDVIKFVLYWLLSFLLAEIMYRTIEKPFINLREKIKWI